MVDQPPSHAAPLLEALRRSSEPETLPDHLPVRWPPGTAWPAITRFFERLIGGELVCWARRGSPCGDWQQIPATAWSYLEIGSWHAGTIRRLSSRPRQSPPQSSRTITIMRDGEPSQVLTLGGTQTVVAEAWYDAQIIGLPKPVTQVSRASIRSWLTDYVLNPTDVISERDDLRAARAHFGVNISRDWFREVRREVLEEHAPELLKRGRRADR